MASNVPWLGRSCPTGSCQRLLELVDSRFTSRYNAGLGTQAAQCVLAVLYAVRESLLNLPQRRPTRQVGDMPPAAGTWIDTSLPAR